MEACDLKHSIGAHTTNSQAISGMGLQIQMTYFTQIIQPYSCEDKKCILKLKMS